MSLMIQAQLKTGLIFGDMENDEYVYMPASELGLTAPLCIYEKHNRRKDVSLTEADHLVTSLSLKPACHPRLGVSTC